MWTMPPAPSSVTNLTVTDQKANEKQAEAKPHTQEPDADMSSDEEDVYPEPANRPPTKPKTKTKAKTKTTATEPAPKETKGKAKGKPKAKATYAAPSMTKDVEDEGVAADLAEGKKEEPAVLMKRPAEVAVETPVRNGRQYFLKFGRKNMTCTEAREMWKTMGKSEQTQWHTKAKRLQQEDQGLREHRGRRGRSRRGPKGVGGR